MNKLIVKEKSIELNNEEINLSIISDFLTININGKCSINEIVKNADNHNITINLKKDSVLTYNRFCYVDSGNISFIFNNENTSIINFNNSIVSNNNYELNIISNIKSDYIVNNINIRAVAKNNCSYSISVKSKVIENTLNNYVDENIKILSFNNLRQSIFPDLYVDSEDIIANHSATISNINKSDLYYLNSKGLSNEQAVKLITEGFLISNIELKKEIKELLNN